MEPPSNARNERPALPASRWRWTLLFGLGLGVLLSLLLGLPEYMLGKMFMSEAPKTLPTTGRIDGPDGVDLAGIVVVASRGGSSVGRAVSLSDGSFAMDIPRTGAFDLHVTDWVSWRDPYTDEGLPSGPGPDYAIEGRILRLPWGAGGVRLRVERVPLKDVTVRVLAHDGTPAEGATVWLSSLTDQTQKTSGEDGTAVFEDLPPRPWRAVATLAGGQEGRLSVGWCDLVPEDQVVDLSVPEGVRVFARFVGDIPDDVELSTEIPHVIHVYQTIPWRPGPDGRMALFVTPGQASLSISATEYLMRTRDMTKSRAFAEGAVAVSADGEVVLQPLGR